MSETFCDFCNAAEPPWEYPADEVAIPEIGWESFGPWCACDSCRELIDADDRPGLAARAQARGVPGGATVALIVYERFFTARRGPARPIQPTPLHGQVFER